jgi:hypothetical protein
MCPSFCPLQLPSAPAIVRKMMRLVLLVDIAGVILTPTLKLMMLMMLMMNDEDLG